MTAATAAEASPFSWGAAELRELAAVVRLLTRAEDADETRLHLGYAEAAQRLNIPEKWLRERISGLPHRKLGKFVQFTEDDIQKISDMHFVRPHQHTPPEESPEPLSIRPSPRARRRS